MTISLVQSNFKSPAGTTLNATVTLPSGVALGNLLVVTFTNGTNNAPTVMAGPAGWTQAAKNQPTGASATITTMLWYLIVGAGQVGQTSWIFTSSTSHSLYLCIEEWQATGGWQASPLDQIALGDTIATPVRATTIVSGTTSTTTQAEELWVAGLAYKATATAESSITAGWTKDTEATLASNNTSTMLYKVASATGAAACQYTIGTAQWWAGCVATFMSISTVTNTWDAVDDPLTVQDNDLTGDIDYAQAAFFTDNLTSVETDAETKVQLATDSLISSESSARTLAAVLNDDSSFGASFPGPNDTFAGRTVGAGSWGTASDSMDTWQMSSPAQSVSGGEGRVLNAAFVTNILGTGHFTDVEIVCRFTLGQAGDFLALDVRDTVL